MNTHTLAPTQINKINKSLKNEDSPKSLKTQVISKRDQILSCQNNEPVRSTKVPWKRRQPAGRLKVKFEGTCYHVNNLD